MFREAVRLVEHQQVARMRRGPGGGLVVTEPTVDAVIDAVVVYLHRVDARLDEVFEARIAIEEIASELAPERLDERDLTELRTFVAGCPDAGDEPRAFHALVAAITRNPALELFVEVLNRVARLYSSDWRNIGLAVGAETGHAHARIAGGDHRWRCRTGPAPHAQAPRGRGRVPEGPAVDAAVPARQRAPRRVAQRQARRGGGAADHLGGRRRQHAAGPAGRYRDRADRTGRGQPGGVQGSRPAARAPPDRSYATGTRRRAVRGRAERGGGDGDRRDLPGAARVCS